MPKYVGAKEAADAIRGTVMNAQLPPEEVHKVQFLKEVAAHLELEPMAENLHRIAQALREHGIELHEGHEYPKMVKRGYDGAEMVANDEQEEKEIVEATRPEPSDAKPAPTSVAEIYDDSLPQAKLVDEPKPGHLDEMDAKIAADQKALHDEQVARERQAELDKNNGDANRRVPRRPT